MIYTTILFLVNELELVKKIKGLIAKAWQFSVGFVPSQYFSFVFQILDGYDLPSSLTSRSNDVKIVQKELSLSLNVKATQNPKHILGTSCNLRTPISLQQLASCRD